MNYSGNDSRFQIGLETVAYGTAATPSVQLEFLNESLKQVNTAVESEALVGAVTTPFYTIVGEKVEGDVSIEVHPDNVGILLASALGEEAVAVANGLAYDHVFTPASGGTSLPSLTAVVDKKADVFTYAGLKIDTLTLETDPTSLLTSTISFIGQKEVLTGSLQTLDPSAVNPFNFNHMKISFGTAGQVAATPINQATSFSLTYSNNLENDLFVADGTKYMTEIDYQKRDITFDIEMLYDATTDGYRTTNFKTGNALSVRVEFTHSADAATGVKYKIVIDMPFCVITEAPNEVSGAERLRIPMTFRALDVADDEAITVTLTDAFDGEYL